MRPRLFTLKNIVGILLAVSIFGLLAWWLQSGAPLPGGGVASTKGKIVFVSTRAGHSDLWMTSADSEKGGEPVALTNDETTKDTPVWSLDGQRIAFTAAGGKSPVPQVEAIDASPGSKVQNVTGTSSAKSQPQFAGRNGYIYYLEAGKIYRTDPSTGSSEAILPDAHLKGLFSRSDDQPNLFSTGGIVRFSVAPDEKHIVFALKLEQGEALLYYDDEAETIALLGAAQHVLPAFLSDGSVTAIITKGLPVQQSVIVVDAKKIEAQAIATGQQPEVPPLASAPASDRSFVARYDNTGKMVGALQLPFAPSGFVAAHDNQSLYLTSDDSVRPGVFSVTFSKDSPGGMLFDQSAKEPTLSPDGTQLAFASGKDIFTVPTAGSAPAKNLTNGKGENSLPVWSPAVK